jgi:hypothetical protein
MTIKRTYSISSGAQRSALAAVGGRADSLSKRRKAQSQKNAQKTRCVPTVSCTLCWAHFDFFSTTD